MHFSEFSLKLGFHCSHFWGIIYIGTHDFRQIENCFAKQTPRQQIQTEMVLLLARDKLYRKWVPFHESWVMMSFLCPPRLPRLPMPTS